MNAFFIVLSIVAAMITIVIMLTFTVLFKCYRICPSNRILVIYGKNRKDQQFTCVHGGARLVFPVLQDYAYLSLEPIQIEVLLRGVLSKEKNRFCVRGVFTVAIGTTPEQMQNAAIRLLGLPEPQIAKQAETIINTQLSQIIASIPNEEINRQQETSVFLPNITESLHSELQKIGLVLINANITEITNEDGNINND
ncbi:MAG: flotillin family protein [Planctomycetaceae bacterium]|jgi:flotillin|nr:flotillin family protein [Planctomycetaceae bacterium]